MIAIEFKNSKSAKLMDAIRYARTFDSHRIGEINRVEVQLRDVFERWDAFAALFWLVVDWKGTSVEYDGMTYHSHSDITHMFYAMQQSHQSWMCYTNHKLSNIDRIYTGESTMVEIEGEFLSNEQINHMIDEYTLKSRNKPSENKF